MTGRPVTVGPFSGGLNNVSVSGEAQDSEVVELLNMEVAEDNSLRSRPPIQYVPWTYVDPATAPGNWDILGVYRYSATEWYLIVVKPTGATTASVQAYLNADFSQSPINIKDLTNIAVNKVTAMAQIDDIAYFCVAPSSTIAGFSWKKGSASTDIAAMKKGNCMVSFKSRLWVAGNELSSLNARVYFSAIGTDGYHPEIWNATDFFDAAAGEGGFITALYALNSTLLIFKNDGTWKFGYPSAPKDGQVDKVSGSVGAANARCVLEFENYVYVYDQGRLYQLINNSYIHLNRFVKFSMDPLAVDSQANGVDISLFNRRVIVRYFNTLYVYSIDTKSWSQWRTFVGTPGRLYELPADSNSTASSTYVAPATGTAATLTSNMIDAFGENYRAVMSTYLNSAGGAGTVTLNATTLAIATTSGTTTAYLNNADGPSNYNIKLSTGYKFRLKGTLTRNAGAVITARMTYLLQNGNTSTVDTTLDLDAVDKTFTAPEGAIAANLHIRSTSNYTMTSMQLYRDNVTPPAALIKMVDDYPDSAVVVEFIDCFAKTKSYDYKAPANYKKMSWWGADVKTSRKVTATLRPVAIKAPPTHAMLAAYTHAQLAQGTFGNPLSFLVVSISVADGADPGNALTENGRVFLKFKKAIRFKQVIFDLAFSSFGTKGTAVKLHTLTTFVLPKEKVVDKVN